MTEDAASVEGDGAPTGRLRVCVAGTWDPDFHRNRALLRFLEAAGCEIVRCRVGLWGERGDSVVRRRGPKLALLLRAAVAYPLLIWRFLRGERVDVVLVPYPGHFDVPLISLLARFRGVPVVFDIFISLFDTIVSDRGLATPRSPLGRAARTLDRLACRGADRILADTPSHAAFLASETGVSADRFRVVWVGADEAHFHPIASVAPDPDLVLFYGTFIPLHGLETIVRAAAELEGDGMRVRIIGDGQEGPKVDALMEELDPGNVERVARVPLERLSEEIAAAGICLGIFGLSGKTDRVVPNKVFQCVAVGRPVVTGDTAAIRSAFSGNEVCRTPVGDPGSLVAAIRRLRASPDSREELAAAGRRRFEECYRDERLGALLRAHLDEVVQSRGTASA